MTITGGKLLLSLPKLPAALSTTRIQRKQRRQHCYCRSNIKPRSGHTRHLCCKRVKRLEKTSVNHDEDDDKDVESSSHHWRSRGSSSFSVVFSDWEVQSIKKCSSKDFLDWTDSSPCLVFRSSFKDRLKECNNQAIHSCQSSCSWSSSSSQRTQESPFVNRSSWSQTENQTRSFLCWVVLNEGTDHHDGIQSLPKQTQVSVQTLRSSEVHLQDRHVVHSGGDTVSQVHRLNP